MMFLARLLTDSAVLTKFEIDEENLTATSIPFYYNTLEGNQPNTYANNVYLWQTEGWEVPETTPTATHPIDSDQASGPQYFDVNLANANYLVGYAVGEGRKAVATTQRLQSQGGGKYTVISAPDEEKLSFQMTNVNARTVSYSFRIPSGTSAEANGDWIGVWKGSTGSYLYDKSKAPIGSKSIAIDDSYGNDRLTLPGSEQFVSGASYMLGYFKSGYNAHKAVDSARTTLAAIVKFKGP